MQKLLTFNDLPIQDAVNVEIKKPEKPLTMSDLPKEVKAGETTKMQPILTLSDLRMNRIKLRSMPGTAPSRVLPGAPPRIRKYNDVLMEMLRAKNLWELMPRNLWRGRRCFIVGGGPSLKKFDWNLLRGEISIGINRAFEKFDPTMMFCMDSRVWGWIVRGDFGEESTRRYDRFKGTRVWINISNFIFPDNIYVIDLDELQPCGSNSGHAAINLAILLGANPIYLLGFDMKGDNKGGQKWFHDGYPTLQSESTYGGFVEELNKDAARIKETGTKVINLTPNSALKCFPMDKMSNIVKVEKEDMRPVVISYYTEDTPYELESKRLIASIVKFGLEYDVVGIPTMGGWKANTYYKAQFIRNMMDKHPNRNLLWVDADAAFIQYPALFDHLEEDIGIFIADWAKIGKGRYKRRLHFPDEKVVTETEVLSGTIYIANNSRSKAFVDAWVDLNKKNYARRPMEQANLQELVFSWKKPLKIKHLPPSYCQIWDTMAYLGEPVIEHYQAARRLKKEVGL